MTKDKRVTRFEVIDHRASEIQSGLAGRILSLHDVAVALSYQDGGRTLKVFITDKELA